MPEHFSVLSVQAFSSLHSLLDHLIFRQNLNHKEAYDHHEYEHDGTDRGTRRIQALGELFEHCGVHNLRTVSRTSVGQSVYHIEYFQAVQYVQNDRHCQRLLQHGQSDINEFVKTVGSVDSRRLIIHIGDCQDTYDQNGHDITGSSP